MSASLSLNGVDLDRWLVTSGTFYRPPVSVRRTLVESPGVHGTTALGLPVFDEPQVSINLVPNVDDSEDSLESLVAELTGLLASPTLVLRRTVGTRVEEATVTLVTVSVDDNHRIGSHAPMTALFAVPGVFLRSLDFLSTGLLAAGTHTLTTWGGTAPMADAVVRFTGPVTSVSAVDETTGTGVSWSGTALLSTEYLYLAPGLWRAWVTTTASDWAPTGTDRTAGMDHPAAGRLQLWPRNVVTGGVVSRDHRVVTTGGTSMIRAKAAWL